MPLLILVTLIALFAINEFYNMSQLHGVKPAYLVGNLATIFFMCFAAYALKRNWEPAHSAILTTAAIVTFSSGIFLGRVKNVISDIAVTLLGLIYVGWFCSYLLFVHSLANHGAYLFFLVIAIWANDIAAFGVGKLFGRFKLNPVVSPKKTIEGSVAGFVVCILAALILNYFVKMDVWHAVFLGAIVGIMAQVSDLVESMIKRDVGVKDSSNLIPGHGGVLDRLDSFILTAPIMYYYLVLFVL